MMPSGHAHVDAVTANGSSPTTTSMTQGTTGRTEADPPPLQLEQAPLTTTLRTQRVTEQKPPMDLVCSLVALFFRHIHPWMPFLDAQQVFGEMGLGEDPSLLCLALFGISLAFSLDSRLTRPSCDGFWKYTKRRIFVEVLEEPSYASLEALVILVLDLSGMTNGPQVWGALAIAVKLAGQLKTTDGRVFRMSLGDEGDDESSRHQCTEVNRRKLFWAIYMIDCYVSITTSQPSQLADYHIAHFVPTRQATWSGVGPIEKGAAVAVTPLTALNLQLKLMATSRDVHATYLDYAATNDGDGSSCEHWLQKFAKCSSELDEWLEALPKSIYTARDNPKLWTKSPAMPALTTMYTYYHALVIYLHGLVAYPSPSRLALGLAAYQATSYQKCAQNVKNLVRITSVAASGNMDKLGWPFGWAVWVAARYTLIAQHDSASAIHGQHFVTLLGCLEESTRYWQVCGKYWWLLRHAWNDMQCGIVSDNSVLRFLLDQRVATSDLEDRFRCDPFFDETRGAQEHDTQQPGGNSQCLADVSAGFGGDESQELLLQDLASTLPGSGGTGLWFSGPLNASSAFQPHYSALFDGTDYELQG